MSVSLEINIHIYIYIYLHIYIHIYIYIYIYMGNLKLFLCKPRRNEAAVFLPGDGAAVLAVILRCTDLGHDGLGIHNWVGSK